MEKIRFISTQFALFFDKPTRPEIFISDFLKEMGDIFDQSPLTLPVPNSPELDNAPVVQFASSNGLHSCIFARKRVDYIHFSSDRKKQYEFDEVKAEILANIEKFSKFFEGKADINRIGFLTNFFVKDEQGGKIIANVINKDFRDEQGGDVRDAKLQYGSRIKTTNGEFELNNITTLDKQKITLYENSIPMQQDGVVMARDFNTAQEKTKDYLGKFTIDNIKYIIAEAEKNFKQDNISKIIWMTTQQSLL